MIVCCGDNVIDMILQGSDTYQSVVGGSNLNTAIAIGRLGQEVGYAMPIGSDVFGDAMIATLEKNDVKYLPALRPSRPTGMAVVSVGQDGQPSYSFYRHGVADIDLQDGELPQLGDEARHLHTGGSPSLGHDHCGDALVSWIETLPEGMSLSLDPNIRPALIEDRQRFLSRYDRILERCMVYRLSEEDASYMYGTADAKEIADLLLGKGVKLVAVTLGADGAWLATSCAGVHVQAIKGDVQDTVAAGDTFMAALLAQLRDDGELGADAPVDLGAGRLAKLGNFAVAAAAINCSRTGCDPPTKAEVERLLADSPQVDSK